MGVISLANSNDIDHFSLLFSQLLDRRYQIRFYSNSLSFLLPPSIFLSVSLRFLTSLFCGFRSMRTMATTRRPSALMLILSISYLPTSTKSAPKTGTTSCSPKRFAPPSLSHICTRPFCSQSLFLCHSSKMLLRDCRSTS